MVLSVLLFAIGVLLFCYSFAETVIHASLYDERNNIKSETFREKEKATDIAAVGHNIIMCMFGAFIIFLAYNIFSSALFTVMPMVFAFCKVLIIMGAIDIGLLITISEECRLKQIRMFIENQWHKEKKISEEHNDEVNMVRACKRVDSYLREAIAFFISVFIFFAILAIFV